MSRHAMIPLLMIALAGPAGAQSSPALQSGDAVRVRGAAVEGRYTFVQIQPAAMVLRDQSGAEFEVALADVQRVDVSRGRRSGGAGFARGLGLGFATGAAVGVALGVIDGSDPPGLVSFSAGEKAIMAGTLLGAAGGALGGILGLASPGEKWERVDLGGARVGWLPGLGVGARYALQF